jgi:hypothetical protein
MFCITSDPAASFGEARAQVTAQASRMIRLWSEQALLCSEAAGVIAARLMMIAAGDPRVGDESGRMVAEKVEALGEVWWHLADANWQAAWGTRAFPGPSSRPRGSCGSIAARCAPTCAVSRTGIAGGSDPFPGGLDQHRAGRSTECEGQDQAHASPHSAPVRPAIRPPAIRPRMGKTSRARQPTTTMTFALARAG